MSFTNVQKLYYIILLDSSHAGVEDKVFWGRVDYKRSQVNILEYSGSSVESIRVSIMKQSKLKYKMCPPISFKLWMPMV